MNIALIGASGRVGSRVLNELLKRGHSVTGLARDVTKIAGQNHLRLLAVDATDAKALAAALLGQDAVISATRFVGSDPSALIDAARQAGVKRVLVVGGAGSLEVAPGQALVDSKGFPPAFKAEANAGRDFLRTLRAEKKLDWTFLSPSAEFSPGVRTGKFRVGSDQLLVDSKGRSWISMEDYAIALVDELEKPTHSRQRFTVGY